LARNLGSAKNEFEKGLDQGKKGSAIPAGAVSDTAAATPTAPSVPVAEHVNPGS
jgi:hypothetical protein